MRIEQMKRMVADGMMTSLNRSRMEIKKAKDEKGGSSASTWYLKGSTSRVVKSPLEDVWQKC